MIGLFGYQAMTIQSLGFLGFDTTCAKNWNKPPTQASATTTTPTTTTTTTTTTTKTTYKGSITYSATSAAANYSLKRSRKSRKATGGVAGGAIAGLITIGAIIWGCIRRIRAKMAVVTAIAVVEMAANAGDNTSIGDHDKKKNKRDDDSPRSDKEQSFT
jgi:hypothetical protein